MNTNSWIRLFFLGILLATAPCTYAQRFKSYIYKKVSDSVQLNLDVFSPRKSTNEKTPVVVLFHGGGLIIGDTKNTHPQSLFFSEHGAIVVVSASYRLVPRGTKVNLSSYVDRCIVDARSTVRWVIDHAEELRVDTNKIILGGVSAGGFLATAIALNPELQMSSQKTPAIKAAALVLFNPAYTPKTRYGPAPVQYITRHSPPAILFYGDQDRFKAGGDEFYNQLKKKGQVAEFWVAKGEKHSFFNKANWREATNRKAFNFLLRLGLLKGKEFPDVPNAMLEFQD